MPIDVASARGPAGRNNRPSPGRPGLSETVEVSLTFDDNRLASLVFGQYDQNVAHIERRLGITGTALGNHLVVKGTPEAAEKARRVFERLYARVQKGGTTLTLGDVDGVIQEVTVQGNLFPSAEIVADNGREQFEQIATRKRGGVRARNAAQSDYIKLLRANELVFAEGPAGTGKTWLAVGHAVSLLEQGHAERLILSRPAVEAGERLGFLPGDMREKVDPYLRPIYDALYDFMEARHVDRGLQTGIIEIAPLAFMRGRTLTNAVVLLDEAQNTRRAVPPRTASTAATPAPAACSAACAEPGDSTVSLSRGMRPVGCESSTVASSVASCTRSSWPRVAAGAWRRSRSGNAPRSASITAARRSGRSA